MFSIAVECSWLEGLPVEDRQAIIERLSANGTRDVIVVGSGTAAASAAFNVRPQLPPMREGHTWFMIGAETSRRDDVIAVAVGRESRAPSVAWAAGVDELMRLGAIPAGGGMESALARRSADEIAGAIRMSFSRELERLTRTGTAYVFGARRLGTLVGAGLAARGQSVAAYLDNNPSQWGRHADGAPISGLDQALDRSLPVIIGTTRFPFTLTEQLKAAGFQFVIPYPVMTLVDPERFTVEIPYIDTYEDIARNRHKYLSEYLNYGDDRSRAVLDALLKYRLTLDSRVIKGHFEDEGEQYFDRNLIKYGPREVFVDAGGFDGQTTLNFLRRAATAETHVYYFEPDPELMARSREAFGERNGITCFQAGAFSREGTVTFSATGTTNGAIGGAAGSVGGVTIAVKRIDDVVTEPATFIKMDIEGAEFDALRGAKEQIGLHTPRLAIAAYHKGGDIWQLGEQIRDLNPSYQLDLRHYTEGGLETVVYAIRKQAP